MNKYEFHINHFYVVTLLTSNHYHSPWSSKTNKNTFVSNRRLKILTTNITLVMHDFQKYFFGKKISICKMVHLYHTNTKIVWHFLIKTWVAKLENRKLCDESLRNRNLGAMNSKLAAIYFKTLGLLELAPIGKFCGNFFLWRSIETTCVHWNSKVNEI